MNERKRGDSNNFWLSVKESLGTLQGGWRKGEKKKKKKKGEAAGEKGKRKKGKKRKSAGGGDAPWKGGRWPR